MEQETTSRKGAGMVTGDAGNVRPGLKPGVGSTPTPSAIEDFIMDNYVYQFVGMIDQHLAIYKHELRKLSGNQEIYRIHCTICKLMVCYIGFDRTLTQYKTYNHDIWFRHFSYADGPCVKGINRDLAIATLGLYGIQIT